MFGSYVSDQGEVMQRYVDIGLPADVAGARYLYICEDGLVHYCSQQRGYPGVPLAEYTTEDVKREFLTAKSCSPNCTVSCVHQISYIDHWRAPQTRLISPGAPGLESEHAERPELARFKDIVGRVVNRPSEVPVGILTAVIGAPVLLLLARGRAGTPR